MNNYYCFAIMISSHLPLLRIFWLGIGGDWWPLRESEEEEERGTEEGWPLGGVAFPGNSLCPDLSAEDWLPGRLRLGQARPLANS